MLKFNGPYYIYNYIRNTCSSFNFDTVT